MKTRIHTGPHTILMVADRKDGQHSILSNCFIHPYDHCVLNLTISFDSFFSLHSNCTRFGILSLYRLSASPFSALLVLIITKWTLFETKNCETTTEKNKANINELGYKFSRHHNSIQF